jgi:uncharacterized protein (TIGR03437 family)
MLYISDQSVALRRISRARRRSLMRPLARAFPASPLQPVNSPVEVTVNGNSAEVLYAGGYPGAVDRYQVNFRNPEGTLPSTATLRLTSGFVPGSDISIPVE